MANAACKMAAFYFDKVVEIDMVPNGKVFYGEEANCSYFTRVVLFEVPNSQKDLDQLREQLNQRIADLSGAPTSSA